MRASETPRVVLTEHDVLDGSSGEALFEDPCGPVAAFFWAAAAVQAPDPACDRLSGVLGRRCAWSASIRPKLPAVSAFEIVEKRRKTMAITVRGTVSLKDAKADLTVSRTRAGLERKARAATADWAEAAEAVEADLAESARLRLAFHHGFYVLAARALGPVIEAIEARRPHRVVFYGHSLGAAVASFLYRWIRVRFRAISTDVRLAIMACPAVCDLACYRRWFEPLGDDGDRARHYYTSGDLVVRGIPGLAFLKQHATIAGEFEGAPASKRTLKGVVFSRLMSHLTLSPGTLRRTVGDGDARRAPPGMLGVREGSIFAFSDARVSRWIQS